MTTRREYLAAFAALTSLSGCTTMSKEEAEETLTDVKRIGVISTHGVYRGFDEEAGVLVYVSNGPYSGGMSVVPEGQTHYGNEDD